MGRGASSGMRLTPRREGPAAACGAGRSTARTFRTPSESSGRIPVSRVFLRHHSAGAKVLLRWSEMAWRQWEVIETRRLPSSGALAGWSTQRRYSGVIRILGRSTTVPRLRPSTETHTRWLREPSSTPRTGTTSITRFIRRASQARQRNGHRCHRPSLRGPESGLQEELIDQVCDVLRRILMTVVADAL